MAEASNGQTIAAEEQMAKRVAADVDARLCERWLQALTTGDTSVLTPTQLTAWILHCDNPAAVNIWQ